MGNSQIDFSKVIECIPTGKMDFVPEHIRPLESKINKIVCMLDVTNDNKFDEQDIKMIVSGKAVPLFLV
jgi:hypothetical protein